MAEIHGKARFLVALQTAQESGKAVAVYADAEDYQTYEVGFVEYVDSSEVVLRCLTPKGEPDGRRALRLEDVVRIDSENAYVKKLQLLYQYRDSLFQSDFTQLPTDIGRDLRSQLEFAKEKAIVVHLVDANDYGPSGIVRAVGSDFVEIERIGPLGEPDGIAAMLIGSISKVHMGRRQDQVLEFLHRYNHGLRKLLES